jgi:hypothetical protein
MSDSTTVLLLEARRALLWGQGDLANHFGLSKRTIQRWDARGSTPMPEQLASLARLVHRHDAELAARIAAAGGASLEDLGLAPKPASAAAPSAPPAPSHAHMADSITCAAADAVAMLPDAVRPALLAAFERARDLAIAPADVAKALSARVAAGKKAAPKR